MRIQLLPFALLFVPAVAHADRVASGSHSVGSVTEIGAGVKELSLETQIVYHSDTTKGATDADPSTTTSGLALIGAGVFRYFIADNVPLAIHAGGFYRSSGTKRDPDETTSSDAGFIGTLSAAYQASLGGGMFIAPTAGAGFFAGSRKTTVNGSSVGREASVSGAVVRAGLGLVFYSSGRFNLFARPEAIVWIGSAKPKTDGLPAGAQAPDSVKFTTIDGGFTCGLSYVF